MFTYKAQRADGKGEIEGYYFKQQNGIHIITNRTQFADASYNVFFDQVEIKPETLRIVIGDSEFTQKELEKLVKPKGNDCDDDDGYIFCPNCGRVKED